jgi:DNA modification methylase
MEKLKPFINRILCGDCQEVMRAFPAGSIDLVVTDPPYLINYRARDGRTVRNDNTDA